MAYEGKPDKARYPGWGRWRSAAALIPRLPLRQRTAMASVAVASAVLLGLVFYQRMVLKTPVPPLPEVQRAEVVPGDGRAQELGLNADWWQEPIEETAPEPAAAEETGPEPVVAEQTPPAAAAGADALLVEQVLQWPVKGEVQDPFGWNYSATYGDYRLHAGMTIRAAPGQPVQAGAAGTVTAVRADPEHGTQVVIDHAGNLTTVYGALAALTVQVGQRVERGQTLGKVGSPAAGRTGKGSYLYFAVRRQGVPDNPLNYLGN